MWRNSHAAVGELFRRLTEISGKQLAHFARILDAEQRIGKLEGARDILGRDGENHIARIRALEADVGRIGHWVAPSGERGTRIEQNARRIEGLERSVDALTRVYHEAPTSPFDYALLANRLDALEAAAKPRPDPTVRARRFDTGCGDPGENEAMRKRTGEVYDTRPLVSFLYLLMRDDVTPGRIETLMDKFGHEPVAVFTNGHLARLAQDIAERLTGHREPMV